jgi:hypothetical protein
LKTRFIVFFLTATQCFLAGCNPRNIPQRREPQDTFPTDRQPLSSPTSRDNERDRGNDTERDRGNDTDRNRDSNTDRDIDRNRDNDNDRERDNNDRGGENRNRQKKYGVNNSGINQVPVRAHEMRIPTTK